MKKLTCLLISGLLSTFAFAEVQINLQNIPNDKNVFIASLVNGKMFRAKRLGSYAIIPDSLLKEYADHALFTVGLEGEPATQYCTDAHSAQFTFDYNSTKTNVIHMQAKAKNKLLCSKLD